MLKGLGRLAALALLAFTLAAPAWGSETLYLNFPPGSGQQNHVFSTSNGSFTNNTSTSKINVVFDAPALDQFWELVIQPVNGAVFTPGIYDNASGFPSPSQPELDFGGNGRGCDVDTGRYIIREVAFDPSGHVSVLAVDFQDSCFNVNGGIRFNSSIPFPFPTPTADAGVDQAVTAGDTVNLDGSLSESGGDGTLSAYHWSQVSGPAVTLSSSSSAQPSFTAPAVPLGGATVVLQLTVTNSANETNSDQVSIKVANPNDPRTLLQLVRDSGGPPVTYTPADGAFNVDGTAPNEISLDFDAGETYWMMEFFTAATDKGPLKLGVYYDGAGYGIFRIPSAPGLFLNGDSTGGCSYTGRFVVRQLDFDSSGHVTAFAVDFDAYCNGNTSGLHGKLRYNSAVPLIVPAPTVDAGAYQNTLPDAEITLSGATSDGGGGDIVAYQWTQLSGPAVLLGDPNAATTGFLSPSVPPGGADLVFQLTVTNSLGLSSTSTVTVHVANLHDPANGLYLLRSYAPGPPHPLLFGTFDGSYSVGPLQQEVTVDFGGGNEFWDFEFDPPANQTLAPGFYPYAQDFGSLTYAGINVSGDGSGCDNNYGKFHIQELVRDSGGQITRFAADFVQHCESPDAAPLYGKIRVNSTVSVLDPNVFLADTAAWEYMPAVLDGSTATAGVGTITAYHWTQVSGPQVALSQSTSPQAGFTAPASPLGGTDRTFQLDVTNSMGLVNSDRMSVHVGNQYDPKTAFIYQSEAGDAVGAGGSGAMTLANGNGYAYKDGTGVIALFWNAQLSWEVNIVAPNGQPLALGTYNSVTEWREGSPHPVGAGMYVDLDPSVCTTVSGQFTVKDIAYDDSGRLVRLAVDFTQYCNGSAHPLRGRVRYNSTEPLIDGLPKADAGPDQNHFVGLVVALDGSHSTGGGGPITSYSWRQVSGLPVVISHPSSAVASFGLNPSWLRDGGHTFVFELSVTNSLGYSAEDTVSIVLPLPATADNFLYLKSDPGDPVGGGTTVQELAPDASFLASLLAPAGAQVSVTQGPTWTLAFAPPSGQRLRTGAVYKRAVKYVPGGGRSPGFYVDKGNSCSTVTGSFNVLEAKYAGSTLMSFAADFEQHCNGIVPALHGVIRYNSTVPPSQ